MNAPELLAEKVVASFGRSSIAYSLGKAARQRALFYDQRLTLNQLSELLNIEVL